MPEKFKNRYRIGSTRLRNWDYGWNGAYFVTICTKNRFEYFGFVENGKMHLSPIGEMADVYWNEIPKHFPFVRLDAFVVMPNHVHGIIIIDKNNGGANVETQNIASLRDGAPKNKFGPQSNNLASIIRGYKIGVTKNARMINPDFGWQRLYYDHIIRDHQSYERIYNYIIENPMNWHDDRFYKN